MLPIFEHAFNNLIMILFAISATPMETGETLYIDVVSSSQGIQSSIQLERTESGHTIYNLRGNEREELNQIRQKNDTNSFEMLGNSEVQELNNLTPFLGETALSELPELDEKIFRVEGGDLLLLQRRQGLLYLTANDQTMVIRKAP